MDTLSPDDMLQYVRIARELKELTGGGSNPWIPLWSTIAGALLAYIPLGVGGFVRGRNRRDSVKAAILAEISYLVKIIHLRGYYTGLKEQYDEVVKINQDALYRHENDGLQLVTYTGSLTVKINDDYDKVYKAHLDSLGALPSQIAKDIVIFYGLLSAIVQDIIPGGNLSEGGGAEAFAEAITLMEQALDIATRLGCD